VPLFQDLFDGPITIAVTVQDATVRATVRQVLIQLDGNPPRNDKSQPYTLHEKGEAGVSFSLGDHTLKGVAYDANNEIVAFGEMKFTVKQ
jgi:hypothetical protein